MCNQYNSNFTYFTLSFFTLTSGFCMVLMLGVCVLLHPRCYLIVVYKFIILNPRYKFSKVPIEFQPCCSYVVDINKCCVNVRYCEIISFINFYCFFSKDKDNWCVIYYYCKPIIVHIFGTNVYIFLSLQKKADSILFYSFLL